MLNESIYLILNRQGRSSDEEEEDPCQPSEEDFQNYNLTLRIISIFVLLAISFVGASLAVISTRVKFLRIHPVIINIAKFFGTG